MRRQDDTGKNQDRRDFFISYTSSDHQWAEWIAMQLDQAGYTLFIQAWDFRPGSNFVAEMDNAAKRAERTVLVLSPAYLESDFAFAEWAAAFRSDPRGRHRRLLPVRIQLVEVGGLLGPVVFIDLVQLEEREARERLLAGVQQDRMKPTTVAFPGDYTSLPSVAFPGSLPSIWNVPFTRNPFFTGRDDLLERLHTQLHTTQVAALSQPQAISGLGGIGKTQLAIEYSYRFRQDYQAVLWARAETTEALNASYTELARLLQLPQQDAQEQEVIVQAVKDWLRSKRGWLLILDNADKLDLVQTFLPTACPGHLLLTTRAQTMGKLARRLEVETLGGQEGALLLLRRAGLVAADASLETASPSDCALATALTDELGGLPLALDQAGAYIEETQCSLANYQQQYQTRRAELLAHRGMLVDDHPEPVATTWSLSFARVEVANPMAAEVLRLCAFLAPDTLPEELLEEALKQFASSEERSSLGQSGSTVEQAWSSNTLDQAVALLRTYSLIQRNPAEKTVRMHRLVQMVLRATLNETQREDWIRFAILLVNALFPPGDFTTTWTQCERYLPQVLICDAWMEQRHLMLPEGASLLRRAGEYLAKRDRLDLAETLCKRSLVMRVRLLGEAHPEIADSLDSLAYVYRSQGRYAGAERLYQRALTLSQQTNGAEDARTAVYLNNLAGLYMDWGKYTEAELLYKQALAINEQQEEVENADTAANLNNLAMTYYEQGRHAEAALLSRQALAIYERTAGPIHPHTIMNLGNLASISKAQYQFAEAEALYKRVLSLHEEALGASHSYVATGLSNLAGLYYDQEKYAEAEPLYKRALAIREQQLGKDHLDTASSLRNLASLYKERGQYAEAESVYKRALAICELRLGEDNRRSVEILNSLAVLYYDQEKYAEAEPVYKRVLAIREQQLGEDHLDTASSLSNLALLYVDQEKHAEAERLATRALVIRERLAGEDHPDTANSLNNLGILYQKLEKYTEAEVLYKRALAINRRVYGNNHSLVAINLNNLADVHKDLKNHEVAGALYRDAMEIAKRVLGSDHPTTMIIQKNYTRLLKK